MLPELDCTTLVDAMLVELVVVVSSTAAWAVAKRVEVDDKSATVCTNVVG